MKMTGDKIYFKSTLNRRTFVNYLSETMKRIDRISENKNHTAIHIGSLDKVEHSAFQSEMKAQYIMEMAIKQIPGNKYQESIN